jgi:hypothetical protein
LRGGFVDPFLALRARMGSQSDFVRWSGSEASFARWGGISVASSSRSSRCALGPARKATSRSIQGAKRASLAWKLVLSCFVDPFLALRARTGSQSDFTQHPGSEASFARPAIALQLPMMICMPTVVPTGRPKLL